MADFVCRVLLLSNISHAARSMWQAKLWRAMIGAETSAYVCPG